MDLATYRCPEGHDLELLSAPRVDDAGERASTREPAYCRGCRAYFWVVTGAVTLVRNARTDTPTMNLMAGLLLDRGRVDQARRLLQISLEASEQASDLEGRARGLFQMARLSAVEGDAEEASIFLGDALAITRMLTDRPTQADLLHEMAGLLAAGGEIEKAIELYLESLSIKEDIGDPEGSASTLYEIAALRVGRGQVDEAIWLCREALEIQQRIGDERGRAATLRLMGGIHATRGQINRSLERFQQSLDAFDRARDPHGRAAALGHMAGLLADIGKINEATKLLREAMTLNRQIGNPCGVAQTLHQTACLMAAAGKIDGAMRFLQKALSIYEANGNVHGQSTMCYEMGYQLSLRGRKEDAQGHLDRALELAEQVGDTRGQAVSLVRLAQITFATDPAEAFVQLRRGERLLARIGAGRDLLDALQSHRSVARASRQAAEFCFASANLVFVHLLRGDATRAAESTLHLAQKLPIERSVLVHQLTAFALLLADKAERRDVVSEQVQELVGQLDLTVDELRALTPEVPTLVEAEGALGWAEAMLGEWLLATPQPFVNA